jgi:uncharacterized protein (TIGR03437 family)
MLRSTVFLLSVPLFVAPLFAQVPFTEFVVFGDSLSDNGNLYVGSSLLGDPTPGPPKYATGEYTDGTDSVPSTTAPLGLWIEQLANKMGLAVPQPFAKGTGGLNYAVAGAQTGHDATYTLGSETAIPWTTDQLDLFMQQNPKPPANALYVFWCGANDILNNASTASTAASTAVSNIQADINTLAAAGAQYFLWVDMPPLGKIPESINSSNSASLDAASVTFNTAWSSAITQLKSAHPGITIIPIDSYALFELLIQNPSLYGFANVTQPAQGQASVNPNTYLFWDQLHPTTVGHDNVASVAYNVIQSSFGGPKYTCTNTFAPVITSVDSASQFGAYSYFAPGSYLEIKGSNLADPTDPRVTNGGQWASADFNGLNAPTMLDGISVSIDGKPAFVSYISPEQINVQAPEDTATGSIAITVTNCKATSSNFTFTEKMLAPGLLAPPSFDIGGKQYMLATFASDTNVTYVLNTSAGASLGVSSLPAKPGDVIIAYGVGFGPVTPTTFPGVIEEQNDTLANPVTISFGSTNAIVNFQGLAGGFVGLYEFYITVPAGLASGDYPINVTQNGVALPQTLYLTVN